MFSKFFNLEKEKQDRIINAAIKEFAEKGYDRASTNEIVKEAGISKGLLFHYFQNKKQLFLFLFDYCYELVIDEFYKKINLQETDFFMRMRQAVMVKMEMLTTYPDIFKFMQGVFLEESAEIKLEFDKKKTELTHINLEKVYEGIDFSKFRDDVDLAKIIKIINWTFEKMSDEAFAQAKLSPNHEINYQMIQAEAEEYFEVMIKCFYKH